jgi:hypothetical protein
MYLSISVSISISIDLSLSVDISIYMYISLVLSVCFGLSIYICLYMSIYIVVAFSLYKSISLSLCIAFSLCCYRGRYLCLFLSFYIDLSIAIALSLSLSICLYLSLCSISNGVVLSRAGGIYFRTCSDTGSGYPGFRLEKHHGGDGPLTEQLYLHVRDSAWVMSTEVNTPAMDDPMYPDIVLAYGWPAVGASGPRENAPIGVRMRIPSDLGARKQRALVNLFIKSAMDNTTSGMYPEVIAPTSAM